jgi:hypothetical protein
MHGTCLCHMLRRIQNQPAEIKTVLIRFNDALIAGRSLIVMSVLQIVGRLCQTPTEMAFHRNALQFIALNRNHVSLAVNRCRK